LKIDLGCGPNKKEGFLGLDQYECGGVVLLTAYWYKGKGDDGMLADDYSWTLGVYSSDDEARQAVERFKANPAMPDDPQYVITGHVLDRDSLIA
jgi:hypothetical protein